MEGPPIQRYDAAVEHIVRPILSLAGCHTHRPKSDT
jgi:hypothetical protein